MHFLKYLEYWKQPAYMKYLVFPQCLSVLDALNNRREFREALVYQNFRDYFHAQQGVAWSLGKWPSKQEIEKKEDEKSNKLKEEENDGEIERGNDQGMDIVKEEKK